MGQPLSMDLSARALAAVDGVVGLEEHDSKIAIEGKHFALMNAESDPYRDVGPTWAGSAVPPRQALSGL